MNVQEAKLFLQTAISTLYEKREANTIVDWVLEKITGKNKIDRLMFQDVSLTSTQQQQLATAIAGLQTHRPVQYVLEEAHFAGLLFFVDESVLIPRPETEELVEWVLHYYPAKKARIIDIGTGSGCIAIALKSKNNQLAVSACDISIAALATAKRNAVSNKVSIEFIETNILGYLKSEAESNLEIGIAEDQILFANNQVYDVIVSNPPYIPEADKNTMSMNVLKFEPHTALFTPTKDPFIFYRAIGLFGRKHLTDGGRLFFEIHIDGGDAVRAILSELGYKDIQLKHDIFENPRMISAEK